MVRLNLYKRILKYILTDFSGLAATDALYQDVDDYIMADDVDNAANNLEAAPNLPDALRPLLISICNTDAAELHNDIQTDFKKILLYKKWGELKRYERCFYYCSPNLFVMDANFLYSHNNNEKYSQQIWLYLEKLCIKQKDREDFIRGLVHQQKHSYLLAYNKVALGYAVNATVHQEELFSFALSASLHDKMPIKFRQELSYDTRALALPNYQYNKAVTYLQYYDIYDAVNDWLHATDLLSAFLRMYQIVEYLVYRQQMSDIINISTIKQSFIRSVKNLNKRFDGNERGTIIENIPKIFGSLSANPINIGKAEGFVGKYFGMDKSHTRAYLYSGIRPNDLTPALARFIYDTRCSIVHNKEAEFHISYNNYEEYKDIVPLMREVHNQLAKEIWNIVNTPNSSISYENSRKIDLF